MAASVIKKVLGSRNERVLRRMQKAVKKINALEPSMEALSDADLKAKTDEFKQRLADGTKLDDLLVEAFAVVREAGKRALGMRHFDVQLIGGMVMHEGDIAEMHTGEGKTLVATAPLYLNALEGNGAHLVTVNDYLAQRDAEQMGKLYGFLGLTTGVIISNLPPEQRKAAYACDITYGTNNEFGFDYLRDNMAFSLEERVQRDRHFAVVDEVDSILIDESRTPLIISGAAEDSSDVYAQLTKLVPNLTKREQEDGEGDYYLDEKAKQAYFTEDGHQKMEELLVKAGLLQEGESLYSPSNVTLMHFLSAVLRAHTLYHIDVDYMVQNGEVVIVDEHTGRAMPGRRWSDGLHQAIEAKEGVKVQGENQTLASITFQNYFRLYNKLAGMTGTADTEAYEFHQTYNLEVVVIPTNRPMVRKDYTDTVYLTAKEKFNAIAEDIKTCVERHQPVLVGTTSIETSELLSALLKKLKVKHEVLNAKQHEREAGIVAQAGRPGAVTIATNMAGRGTDIVLGGSWQAEIEALDNPTDAQIDKIKSEWKVRHQQVLDAGGLHILGTERHESRRIDNQLRGRSGRQGDPGSSRFYLSMEDHLVRIFAADRMSGLLRRLGLKEGEALESKMITKSIANAQKKVENFYMDMRKNLLEYDNVANDQRQVIYAQRSELLAAEEVSSVLENIFVDVIHQVVDAHVPPESLEELWDVEGLQTALSGDFATNLPLNEWLVDQQQDVDLAEVKQKIFDHIKQAYDAKKAQLDNESQVHLEKTMLLQTLDNHWREHLVNMDHLRQSINLRGYAQKDPKQEYKREAFELFSALLDRFKYEVISTLVKLEIQAPEQIDAAENQWRDSLGAMQFQHAALGELPDENAHLAEGEAPKPQPTQSGPKVGRNDPCPCGSGKKYKQCHGKLT